MQDLPGRSSQQTSCNSGDPPSWTKACLVIWWARLFWPWACWLATGVAWCSSGIVCLNVVGYLFQHIQPSLLSTHQLDISSPAGVQFNCQRTFTYHLWICSGFPVVIPVVVFSAPGLRLRGRRSPRLCGVGKGAAWSAGCAVPGHCTSSLEKTQGWFEQFRPHCPNIYQDVQNISKHCIGSEWGDAVMKWSDVMMWSDVVQWSGQWSSDCLKWWSCHVVMIWTGDNVKWQWITMVLFTVLFTFQVVVMSSGHRLKCWWLQ